MISLANDKNFSTGMPQGSNLTSLFFNIFLLIVSFFLLKIQLFATDDNTIYSSDENANIVINRLRQDFVIILEWFYKTA